MNIRAGIKMNISSDPAGGVFIKLSQSPASVNIYLYYLPCCVLCFNIPTPMRLIWSAVCIYMPMYIRPGKKLTGVWDH